MNEIQFDNLYPKKRNIRKKSHQTTYKVCIFIFALLMLAAASVLFYRYISVNREYNDLLLFNSKLQQEKDFLATQVTKYEESYNSISSDNQTLKNELDSLKSDLEASKEKIHSLELAAVASKVVIDSLNGDLEVSQSEVNSLQASQKQKEKENDTLNNELSNLRNAQEDTRNVTVQEPEYNTAEVFIPESPAVDKPKTFNIGSSKQDVKAAMGEPQKVKNSQKSDMVNRKLVFYNITTWYYGTGLYASSITFDENDKVIEWDEKDVALKVG